LERVESRSLQRHHLTFLERLEFLPSLRILQLTNTLLSIAQLPSYPMEEQSFCCRKNPLQMRPPSAMILKVAEADSHPALVYTTSPLIRVRRHFWRHLARIPHLARSLP